MCKATTNNRCGAGVLAVIFLALVVMLTGSFFLRFGEQYKRIRQKIQMESAATELMQDIYRVQAKNYAVDVLVLQIGQERGEYSIRAATSILCTKRFDGVRFSSVPMNFRFNGDGTPYAGGTIYVKAEDNSARWAITILPVTGRVAVNRT